MNVKLTVLVLLVGFLTGGCSGLNRGVNGMFHLDTDLTLLISADANINPDEKWASSPVYLRLYELKSDSTMKEAEFFELFNRDTLALGDALLARRELARVLPGEYRKEKFVLNVNTRHIAIFAEFHHYQDSNYKIVLPITPHNVIEDQIVVHIKNNHIHANKK